MAQLQQLGLVELLLGRPNTYRAAPLHDLFKLLVEKKKNEYNELLRALEKMKKTNTYNFNDSEINEDSFRITAAKKGGFLVVRRVFLNAKKSHDGTMNCSTYIKVLLDSEIREIFEESMTKGVNFRYLLYCDRKNKKEKIIELNKKYFSNLDGAMKIKFSDYAPEAIFAILDSKEVLMHTHPLPNWEGTSCLHSTNKCLVGVIQKYFETLWSQAEALSLSSKQITLLL